jgi:hemolysin activation/secretion protein
VKYVLFTLFIAIACNNPLAASPPMPPPATDPGRVERDLRPLPSPASKPASAASRSAESPGRLEDDAYRFTLRGITLEGNRTLPDSALSDLWQDLLGEAIAYGDIKSLAREITRRYRNAGYILAQALVPAQEVTGGVVRIEVVEGHVARLVAEEGTDLSGHSGTYAKRIPESNPLNIRALERWLLLINDLPGVTAKSIFKPSPEAEGGADLFLRVDRGFGDLLASLDNRAGAYYQDWAASLEGSRYNAMGLDERLFARIALAGDGARGEDGGYRNLALGLELPLGGEGLRFNLSGDHTRSVPGDELVGMGYAGRSTNLTLRVQYPLQRSRGSSLYAHLGGYLADSRLELQGTSISDDRIRALSAGLRLDWAGLGGVSLIQLEVSGGLNGLGASEAGQTDLSRAEGDPRFLKARLDLVHIRPLGEAAQLRLDLLAQGADRKLLSGEELTFGGNRIGRGFDASEITGDTGAGIGIELAWKLPRDLELFGFYDAALVADKTGGKESLVSAGAGLRFVYRDRLRGQLELAKPLSRGGLAEDVDPDEDWRFFVRLTYDF